MSHLKGPHFHVEMASLARYMQYLLNLQHNTARMAVQQHTCLMAYEEIATATMCEIQMLRHENVIIRSGAHPPSELDCDLQEIYRDLSDTKNGWNYTCILPDITHEEVDIRTHGIIHLEHHVERQDAELEERAEVIADLEQQLLELQGQAPPEPTDLEEIDAMSGIDED
jgi:hypothetical protein